MKNEMIATIARRYFQWSICLIVGLAVMTLLLIIGTAYWNRDILQGLAISVVFTIITVAAYGLVWKKLAMTNTRFLAKFYLGAPVVRLLAALVVMVLFYITHRQAVVSASTPSPRGMMLGFTVIFFAFYLVQMVFESFYFSRVEKRNKI